MIVLIVAVDIMITICIVTTVMPFIVMHLACSVLTQAEKQEKREEEIHLAELTATAKNDEEVIAKLHKVCYALLCCF